jgi:hypothetical protein
MSDHFKKLISDIDQIVLWLKNNPSVALPPNEKSRLIAILSKISERQELTPEEWEKYKPKEQPKHVQTDNRHWLYLNKIDSSAIRRKKKPRNNNLAKNNGKINNRQMTTCSECQIPISIKNISKHKKKCIAGKQKGNYPSKMPSKNSSSATINKGFSNESKAERKLDGSYGTHIIRENGRFGSYPVYDNMEDESKP